MRRIVARAISILLALSVAAPLASAVAQGPPTAADDSFTVDGLCEFPVHFEMRGKMKTTELPGGRMIFIFPSLTATLTNVNSPANQETLSTAGAFRQTVLKNGDVQTVFMSRNLIFGPAVGFVLAIGKFSDIVTRRATSFNHYRIKGN
jgi:hypothetical protein